MTSCGDPENILTLLVSCTCIPGASAAQAQEQQPLTTEPLPAHHCNCLALQTRLLQGKQKSATLCLVVCKPNGCSHTVWHGMDEVRNLQPGRHCQAELVRRWTLAALSGCGI